MIANNRHDFEIYLILLFGIFVGIFSAFVYKSANYSDTRMEVLVCNGKQVYGVESSWIDEDYRYIGADSRVIHTKMKDDYCVILKYDK